MSPTHPGPRFLTQTILAYLKRRLVVAILAAISVAWLLAVFFFITDSALANSIAQLLPFSQTWTNTGLITTDDNWSGVPGIEGYRGDGLTGSIGVDPQTILADGTTTPLDVNANQTDPIAFIAGGVTEFQLADPVVALAGSVTADAPFLLLHLNTTGQSNIQVSYILRDLDGSSDDAVQPVALQYRVGNAGNFTNLPAGYVADATTGPNQATLVTPVSVTLPPAADNQPQVQIRLITTNAGGSDEWVGIDDLAISAGPTCTTTITVTNTNDSGGGSLRQAIAEVCDGGTVGFDNNLSGQTITLTGGEIALTKTLTIDGGSLSQHVNISGNNSVRIFNIGPGVAATLADLNLINGQASDGGGIYNQGSLTVTNSTLSGNSASSFGGGVFNSGILTVTNSTLSGNSSGQGGGIRNNTGTLTVANSTLSGNSATSGGGIQNASTLHLRNTLIANSPSGGDCSNSSTIPTHLNNLIEDGSCSTGATGFVTGDPRLSPLQVNAPGGTATHALLPGSPAIDAGDNATCANTPVNNLDQRGIARTFGPACDIGAFESRGFSLSLSGGTPQSAAINTAFAQPLAVSVSNAFGEPIGPGGVISFTGPASGASINPAVVTATTDANGDASATVTANGTAGGPYTVAATANGATPTINFSLTNTPPAAPEIAVLGNSTVIADGDAAPSTTDGTDFGGVTPSQAVTHTFTISNSGTGSLTLTGSPVVSITGVAAGNFTVVSQPTTPVISNTTTTFQVRFTPSVTGTRAATVTITNDDDNENPYDFAIQGVGAAVTTQAIYLPFIFKDFIAAPDLVVESLSAGSGITLTLRNAGSAPATNGFWVDVYFNPNPTPPRLNQPWDTIAPAGAVWGVTKTLAPGESLILTSSGVYYFPNLSSPSFPAGAQVYAFVDSINFSTTYGNVLESDESNNVFGPVLSTADSRPIRRSLWSQSESQIASEERGASSEGLPLR